MEYEVTSDTMVSVKGKITDTMSGSIELPFWELELHLDVNTTVQIRKELIRRGFAGYLFFYVVHPDYMRS